MQIFKTVATMYVLRLQAVSLGLGVVGVYYQNTFNIFRCVYMDVPLFRGSEAAKSSLIGNKESESLKQRRYI